MKLKKPETILLKPNFRSETYKIRYDFLTKYPYHVFFISKLYFLAEQKVSSLCLKTKIITCLNMIKLNKREKMIHYNILVGKLIH